MILNIKKIISNPKNFSKGRNAKIEYLVIHYTANNGDSALSNLNYFKRGQRNASAHYFVDEKEIGQSVEDMDTAWHCGTNGKYYNKYCRNSNSIGVEMCSKIDSKGKYYFEKSTIENTIKLVKSLIQKYKIKEVNILRHYDVTRKMCPKPFIENEILWENFKNSLKQGEKEVMIKRVYRYKNREETLNVINKDGENYIKIRDLANLLQKNLEYNSDSKITTII